MKIVLQIALFLLLQREILTISVPLESLESTSEPKNSQMINLIRSERSTSPTYILRGELPPYLNRDVIAKIQMYSSNLANLKPKPTMVNFFNYFKSITSRQTK